MAKIIEKYLIWEAPTVGAEMSRKIVEYVKYWEIQAVVLGFWRENLKKWKLRHKHCMNWNMVRNTEKIEKWKLDNVGPGIWRENWHRGKGETHIVGHGIWRGTPKYVWNEKHTL